MVSGLSGDLRPRFSPSSDVYAVSDQFTSPGTLRVGTASVTFVLAPRVSRYLYSVWCVRECLPVCIFWGERSDF